MSVGVTSRHGVGIRMSRHVSITMMASSPLAISATRLRRTGRDVNATCLRVKDLNAKYLYEVSCLAEAGDRIFVSAMTAGADAHQRECNVSWASQPYESRPDDGPRLLPRHDVTYFLTDDGEVVCAQAGPDQHPVGVETASPMFDHRAEILGS
jgi:hypothetical protein